MPATRVEVRSRVVGRPEDALDPVLLELLEERITVAELIRRTVEEQIHELQQRRRLDATRIQEILARQYLTPDEVARQAQHGRIALPKPPPQCEPSRLHVPAEVARALTAFEHRQFYIFVGGRQLERLDEVLDFAQQTKVVFLRLMPLVGG